MKRILPLLMLSLSLSLWGGIGFNGLDLGTGNRLLFKAESDASGAEVPPAEAAALPGTLYISNLDDASVFPLTVFPEKLDLLNGTLLIRSVYGIQRIPLGRPGSPAFPNSALPQTVPGFPSFTGGSAPGSRVESISPSPDGKWILFVEPVTFARGNLVLVDSGTGMKAAIASEVGLPGRAFPASWSSDSRGFVYERDGKLYYYPVDSVAVPPAERYRLIGDGAINSVCWGAEGNFYYLRGSTVYRVRSSELFARTLYSNFLDIGNTAGKLPFEFDPNFDSYKISPSGDAVLLIKGGRNIFYYPLGDKSSSFGPAESLPYVMLPRSSSRMQILWSAGAVTVLVAPYGGDAKKPSNGKLDILAYRLKAGEKAFSELKAPPAFSCSLSPDGTKLCFWGRDGAVVYDYGTWEPLVEISARPVLSALWASRNELITGDADKLEYLRLSDAGIGERKLICLTGVAKAGFEKNGTGIFAQSAGEALSGGAGETWYRTDGTTPWTRTNAPELKEASQVSQSYRVYLERGYGFFENVPMVRNISSVGTRAVLPVPSGGRFSKPSELPGASLPSRIPVSETPGLYSHGGRGYREAALCFDLYDDDAGLSLTLDALSRFGISATFFINGEFIRRHPEAAKEIAEAGHETVSMFYAPINLSDARYLIDKDFITRGLARNEDEFFKATGKELGLLWHPPYYAVSAEIIHAAGEAGYKTITRDTDPGDWITRDDARHITMDLLSAVDMIDNIMDAKQGGSIIPVRLGLLPGGRKDYLFNSLEVLLDALSRDGYALVTVSDLINHSKRDF